MMAHSYTGHLEGTLEDDRMNSWVRNGMRRTAELAAKHGITTRLHWHPYGERCEGNDHEDVVGMTVATYALGPGEDLVEYDRGIETSILR